MTTIKLVRDNSLESLRKRSLRDDALYVAIIKPFVARKGVAVELPASRRDLLIAMLARGSCTMCDLVDAIYGHDPSGGPDNPSNVISVNKYGLVSISAALGLRISRGGKWHTAEFLDDVAAGDAP